MLLPDVNVLVYAYRHDAASHDSKLASGPIALQYAAGTVNFRRVEIRAL